MKKYLISACLVGLNTRYDGKNNIETVFLDMVKKGAIVPFCPEQAGGMCTPREPSEIVGGDGLDVLMGKARVITPKGHDVTANFLKGAKETLKLAKILDSDVAILKSKSPSCGCKCIYDGSFGKTLRSGMGVTAALLSKNGIKITDSEEVLNDMAKLQQ